MLVNKSVFVRISDESGKVQEKAIQIPLAHLLLGAAFATAVTFPLRLGEESQSVAGQCSPASAAGADDATRGVGATRPRNADLVQIPAGTVQIGDDAGAPDERPSFQSPRLCS